MILKTIFIIRIVGILPWLVEIWGSVLHIQELHADRHVSADRYAVHDSIQTFIERDVECGTHENKPIQGHFWRVCILLCFVGYT